MNKEQFWNVVGSVDLTGDNPRRDVEAKLDELTEGDLLAFATAFNENVYGLYSWKVWAFAFICRDEDGSFGCGDDEFFEFLSAIVWLGRDLYELALSNPDLIAEDKRSDQLKPLSLELVELATEFYSTKFGGLDQSVWQCGVGLQPRDEPWSEDDMDYFRANFPRSVKKWGLLQISTPDA